MKTVTLDLEIIQVTDDALLLTDGTSRKWVGKKQIKNYDWGWELGPQTVEIEIPEWLAIDAEWI